MSPGLSASELAARLLEAETVGQPGAAGLADATVRTCSRLHQQLAWLVGATGSDLLLARAVSVATAEDPLVEGVRWQPGDTGGLEGLRERLEALPVDRARGACMAVLTAFLSLLFNFIGADLTVRQIRRAWPDLAFRGTNPEALPESREEDR